MKALYLFLLWFPLAIVQPVTAQKSSKAAKAAQEEKAFREMQTLVNGKQFQIKIDRVYPQSGHDVSRFNPNGKITIKDSIAEGRLPFFGRAYNLPYGEGGGIEFNAPMKDQGIHVTEKIKKKFISFHFFVPGQNDVYQINIDIVSNGGCSINLTSNNRAHISYSGTISAIEEQ